MSLTAVSAVKRDIHKLIVCYFSETGWRLELARRTTWTTS